MSRRRTLLEGLLDGSQGMSSVKPAELHTLAGPYALDALPPHEMRFFEAHLDACPVCRQEVRELQATAARMGAASERPAPAALRERVLSEIDRTRQLPPLVREPVRSPSRWRRLQPAVAPAAAVLLVVAAALALVVARLTAQVNEFREQSTRMYALLTALTAQDVRNVPLSGPHAQGARLVVSPEDSRAVLLVEGLPRPGADQAYELWLIGPAGPQPGGFLRPDRQGQAIHVLPGLRDVEAIGVTLEPIGGSSQPTSPLLITGSLSGAQRPQTGAEGKNSRQGGTVTVVT